MIPSCRSLPSDLKMNDYYSLLCIYGYMRWEREGDGEEGRRRDEESGGGLMGECKSTKERIRARCLMQTTKELTLEMRKGGLCWPSVLYVFYVL